VTIDKVIIENQISPIANRMKTIQGMIAQYFIMCGIQDVTFVSSVNKLKAFTDTDQNKSAQNKSAQNKSAQNKLDQNKSDYKDRKKLGIEVTKGIIEKMKDWAPFFLAHKKKDDLADSFLQGIWFLQK
jgi:hypothetical protein